MQNRFAPLSRQASAVWAKFDWHSQASMPLYRHLDDTAEVARRLFSSWLSISQRKLLADTFGAEALAEKLAVWLAASHDIGKCSEVFADKAPPLRSQLEDAGLVFQLIPPMQADAASYPHGLAGQIAVKEHLRRKLDALDENEGAERALASVNAIAQIVGGHHGVFPQHERVPFRVRGGEDSSWRHARQELLSRADSTAQISEGEWHSLLRKAIPEPAQALLTGYLIVCDWIASDASKFPYEDFRARASKQRATNALARLKLENHWRPEEIADTRTYYADRFGIQHPRPLQEDAVRLVNALTEPSCLLIEAPTGEGKTEVAFAAAEAMAARLGLHGVFMALPTRATSNAMFTRTLDWIHSGTPGSESLSVSLAHAKAELDDEYFALLDHRSSNSVCTYDEDQRDPRYTSVIVNQWFRGRKRNVFANFVIGTIDQLLFMTLKSRHLALRHLGLSSKVVIIDEIHSPDPFMLTYLTRALEWLGAYGVPVVALSATIPKARRIELLSAYRKGALKRVWSPQSDTNGIVRVVKARKKQHQQAEMMLNNELGRTSDYPLLTAASATQSQQVAPNRSNRRIDYQIETISRDRLVEQLLIEVKDAGCVAVVCNTVDRAQELYSELKYHLGNEVELFHSRFTVESRNRREKELVKRLGSDSGARPKRKVIVATQVIESSLDVDFDIMFTEIAPTDLLIQRIGRVHRHQRDPGVRPPNLQQPRIVLFDDEPLRLETSLESPTAPPKFGKGTLAVYGDALLLRTTAALSKNFLLHDSTTLAVPEDVPTLIADTYADDFAGPTGWETRVESAEEDRAVKTADQQQRSKQFVISSPGVAQLADWSRMAQVEASEERLGAAQVRDSETALEVVLVQRRQGCVYPLPGLPPEFCDERVDLDTGIRDDLARAVATCSLTLPAWMSRGRSLEPLLEELESNGFEGWQQSTWLRGVLPLVLDNNLCTTVLGHKISYNLNIGLTIEREEARGRASN